MTELGFDLGRPTPGPGPFPYPTRPCSGPTGCPQVLPLMHGTFAQPVPFPTSLSQLSSLEGRA